MSEDCSVSQYFFQGKDFLTTKDITREQWKRLMLESHRMRVAADRRITRGLTNYSRVGRRVKLAFFEPSTRTFESSHDAALELGCQVSGFRSSEGTSTKKGESLRDTVRTLGLYNTDLLINRHPLEGSAQIAAEECECPVINAGDGTNEHPTQTGTDLLCMLEYFGAFAKPFAVDLGVLEGKRFGVVGDPTNGRTYHSMVPVLRQLGMSLTVCAPDELQVEPPAGLTCNQYDNISATIEECDVLYMTRFQWERPGMENLQHLRGHYKLTRELVERINPKVAIMHPLPRVEGEECEIDHDVDSLLNALYFRLQTPCGFWFRMALINLLMRPYHE